MIAIEQVRSALPEAARDIRLNLQSVLEGGALNDAQKWGVAAACAIATRQERLKDAVLQDALGVAGDAVVEDARAAAVLMGMNNVYYRFRHMIGKSAYSQKPARLRMQRIAQPLTNKVDFELYCLAVSALNGCEACVRAHEQVVVDGGLSEEQVHDAVRIAAVLGAAAVALDA
jgi:alkyl hydroperoxide reductase subunit D